MRVWISAVGGARMGNKFFNSEKTFLDIYPYQRSNWRRGSFSDFRVDFHKTVVIRSSVCRTILVRCALESPDPGASNGGSNFIF